MAQLRIKDNVRIGRVYDCNFGKFKKKDGTTVYRNEALIDYNYRIPNEIIKTRLVIVIGKHRGAYIVVPISATKEEAKKKEKEPEFQGFHVKLEYTDIPTTPRYPYGVERWGLCNLVTTIDGNRLQDLYHSKEKCFLKAHMVSDNTLRKIRRGVLIAIGLRDWLKAIDVTVKSS